MKLTVLLGLPIVHAHTGKILGEVTGWLIDGEKKQLSCLLAKAAPWYQGVCAIGFSHIVGMGTGAVLVAGEHAMHPLALDRDLRALADEAPAVLNAPVFLPDGESAGIVKDLLIDDRGQIKNLILQDEQIVEQRRLLVLGQCALIARSDTPVPNRKLHLPPIGQSEVLEVPEELL